MERRRIVAATALFALALTAMAVVAGSPVTDVTASRAYTLIQERSGRGDFVILDVRTPGEFAESHVAGSVNLDAQSSGFEARLRMLDRAKTYLVYCQTGRRSQRAVQTMERAGFSSVLHMTEGFAGWQKRKLPVSRDS